jgi:pyruvate formate lyase activating enzyme
VARLLKSKGIHVALQTCGLFQWDLVEAELLPWIDLVYFNLKCLDTRHHRQWTGRSNRTILDNFSKFADTTRVGLVCTIPLIGGKTTRETLLRATADAISGIKRLSYRLQPYHAGGQVKATALGRPTPTDLPAHALAPDEYQRITAAFAAMVRNRRERRQKWD